MALSLLMPQTLLDKYLRVSFVIEDRMLLLTRFLMIQYQSVRQVAWFACTEERSLMDISPSDRCVCVCVCLAVGGGRVPEVVRRP